MGEKVFERRQKGARQAFLSILAANLFQNAAIAVLTPLKTQIQDEFRCSDAQTTLPKFVGQFSYLIAAGFAGIFMSQTGMSRRLILANAIAVVSLCTMMLPSMPTIGMLCLPRILVGAGCAFFNVITPSVVVDYYPIPDRGYVLALGQITTLAGGAAAYAIVPMIAEAAGWKAAVFAVGAPGLMCALSLRLMREPQQGVHDAVVHDESSLLKKCQSIFTNPHFLVIVAATFMNSFAEGAGAEAWPECLNVSLCNVHFFLPGLLCGL